MLESVNQWEIQKYLNDLLLEIFNMLIGHGDDAMLFKLHKK